MTDIDDIGFTAEEIEQVNAKIAMIQTQLNSAQENIRNNNHELAIVDIQTGIDSSDCPLCKRELGLLKADLEHNIQICLLESDTCAAETDLLIERIDVLKEEFIPMVNTKKAKIDKLAKIDTTAPLSAIHDVEDRLKSAMSF